MSVRDSLYDLKDWAMDNKAIVIGGLVSLVVLVWLIVGGVMKLMVDSDCRLAMKDFKGDCAVAMRQYVEDQSKDIRFRNRMVWALGRMKDQRALWVLKKYYTGSKESESGFLDQTELKRAIDRIEK